MGTWHFGHRAERRQDQERTATLQTLTEIVGALRNDQRELLNRVAVVEKKVSEPSVLPAVPTASLNPSPPFALTKPPPVAGPSSNLVLAPQPAAPVPDLLLPHPPAFERSAPPAPEAAIPMIGLPKPPPPAAPTPEPPAEKKSAEPLAGEQRSWLVKNLRNHRNQPVVIRAAAENAPAVKLAISLKSVFREAGWSVDEIEMTTRQIPQDALLLSSGVFPPAKEFVAVYSALAGSGFLVTSDLDPNQGRQRVVVSVGAIH